MIAMLRAVGSFGLLAAFTVASLILLDDHLMPPSPDDDSSETVPHRWDGPTPSRPHVLTALQAAEVVPERPDRAGYDRECGADSACVFGPDWSDDTSAAQGHDGCDTRNNVLSDQLSDLAYREDTDDCVVIRGRLQDPYTAETIEFSKDEATEVGIDHIYPLALAWDMGAADWPLDKRMRFANDPVLNLLAVSGSANSSKGDSGPGAWMPINRGYACTYAARYLEVANSYGLPITEADHQALSSAIDTCPATAKSHKPSVKVQGES